MTTAARTARGQGLPCARRPAGTVKSDGTAERGRASAGRDRGADTRRGDAAPAVPQERRRCATPCRPWYAMPRGGPLGWCAVGCSGRDAVTVPRSVTTRAGPLACPDVAVHGAPGRRSPPAPCPWPVRCGRRRPRPRGAVRAMRPVERRRLGGEPAVRRGDRTVPWHPPGLLDGAGRGRPRPGERPGMPLGGDRSPRVTHDRRSTGSRAAGAIVDVGRSIGRRTGRRTVSVAAHEPGAGPGGSTPRTPRQKALPRKELRAPTTRTAAGPDAAPPPVRCERPRPVPRPPRYRRDG